MSELNLNLDQLIPPPRPPRQPLLPVLLLLQIAILALLAILFWKQRSPAPASSGMSPEQIRELALKMENLDLPRPAVALWQKYISVLQPPPEKHARLLYRQGTICQQARLYEDAVSYYAQSEAVCKSDSLSPEIGRRTQECLEQLGLFSARNRDLQQRTDLTSAPQTSDGPVLAEIGAWKITRKDLERHMEQTFDQTVGNSCLSPEEILKQKKSYMKMLSEGNNFLYFLQQFIFDQLLAREVREQKLREDAGVLEKCRALEKQLLDSMVLEKAIGRPLATEEEARKYYEAHRNEFKKDDKEQPFSEVRDSIANQLTSQKRKEAQQKYFQNLVEKYDVVFHTSALPNPSEAPAKQLPQQTQKSPSAVPAPQNEAIEL